NFKSYLHDPYDSTSISTNRVFALCEANGYLWVGSQYQGLDRFDPVSEEFKRYHNDPEDSALVSINWIFDIIKDESCLWIGTLGDGLFKFDLKSEKFTQYKNDPNDIRSISSNDINKLFIDSSENLWIGLGGIIHGTSSVPGLNRFNRHSETFIHYRNEPNNKFSLADNTVWGIGEDSRQNLYVGTGKSLLHIYDREEDRFLRLLSNKNGKPFAPIGSGWNFFRPLVSSILADSYGYLWIGTMSGGLNRYNSKNGIIQHFSVDQNSVNGLKSNNIMRIYEDNQSTIWIPMNMSGLTKVIPSQNRFFKLGATSKHSDLLIESYVYALYQDSKGLLWIGTNDGEIYSYDQKKNSLKDYSSNIPQMAREVNVFFEDSKGTIWAGMRGIQDMAWRLNSNSDRFEKFSPGNDNNWSDILSIIEDEKGSLWFSTEYAGIYEINEEQETLNHYTRNWEQPEPRSITHTKVYSSLYDSEGNYWFGTYNGLNLLNPESKDFDSYLLTNSIWSLFEDSNDRFWIGSRFRGLILFDRETREVIEQFTTDDGLSSNAIYGITEDSQGFIWIMTPPGLTRLDTKSMTFTVFDESDGISNYFTDDPDAMVKLDNGELLFGGKFGITGVNPDQFTINKFPPKVVITELNIFDKPYKERGMLDSDIELDYNQNDLTIGYVGLHFKDPKQNKYKYRLEPYERDWKEAGSIRSARYTSLDPGKYTFKVTSSNSDGVWSEKYATLNIEVVPPWWNTNTAYILYLLAAFGFLYSIRRFELKRQRKNASIKESKLRAESAELQAKAAEAQASVIQAENERKTKELEEARKLQLSMLPKEIPQLPNLDIAVYMKTATEVGGDYYDFHLHSDGTLTVVLGDATGHGMQSGMMVSIMKSLFMSD
ncbi:MAG: two-component regulator propeller domain-containing protein, partial [Melioribacteraceae bacterium]|nr:two-component regulator propeller domain-containing protein [Melioribacteraceae bacterium]